MFFFLLSHLPVSIVLLAELCLTSSLFARQHRALSVLFSLKFWCVLLKKQKKEAIIKKTLFCNVFLLACIVYVSLTCSVRPINMGTREDRKQRRKHTRVRGGVCKISFLKSLFVKVCFLHSDDLV